MIKVTGMNRIKGLVNKGFSLLASCLFLLLSNPADAGNLNGHQRIYTTSTTQVVVGQPSATTTVDLTGQAINPNFYDASVKDLITFGIDHHYATYFPNAMDVRIVVSIDKWDLNGNLTSLPAQNLEVKYHPFDSNPYVDKNAFAFTGGYKFTVTITDIYVNNVQVTTLPANLYLDADINIERYYDFSTNASTPVTVNPAVELNIDCDPDGIYDELEISWNTVVGAEEYQLEWTFVNDYDATYGNYISNLSLLNYDFRGNSTRITTTGTSYNITLAFDHGYILYRVRAIGRDVSNISNSIVGVWSEPDNGTVSSVTATYHNTTPHEDGKNWQYSSTFAEEGKKKEVVSYYDGSLRNRQTVTKVNSDNNTIVGETKYDYQGRPAVNVLPVPVTDPTCAPGAESAIKYYPEFNKNSDLDDYSKADFDHDVNGCGTTAGAMSTTSGASNYYSPSNPDKAGHQAFVPDAEQYPFTQIEYTPDNTGRIRRQSGVGPDYQLGSGHETKYYYGKPNQVQLDRMFGSEVGYASHYKKNLVVDANGQVSVTYLDQEGRTIATALAGDAPNNANTTTKMLEPLPSESTAAKTLTIDLFEKDANGNSLVNTANQAADAIEFNSQMLVAYDGLYTFNYSLNIDKVTDPCLVSSICFNCIYDLEIKVVDECGVDLVPQAINKMVGRFTMVNGSPVFSTDCNTPIVSPHNESFQINLTKGNYTVSKTLKVNEDARDFYVQEFLDPANNTCIMTLDDFINDALANIDTTDCSISCAECVQSLGSRDDFVSSGKGTELEYDLLYEECMKPCEVMSLCEVTYLQLLADVSPDGQYGDYLNAQGQVNATGFPLSVYNIANFLPRNYTGSNYSFVANWRNPLVNVNGTNYPYYLDDDGARSIVKLIPQSSGGYSPAVSSTSSQLVLYNSADAYWYTYPENLANLSDFIANWKESWARSLVQYHPEYCYYETCKAYGEKPAVQDVYTSDKFDELLMSTNTFADAVANGFINPNYASITTANGRLNNWFGFQSTLPYDAFVTNANSAYTYTPYSSQLTSKFNAYQTYGSTSYSMVEMAAIAARCGTQYNLVPANHCKEFGLDYVPGNATLNTQIRDQEWNLLKNFYFSEKQKLQQKRADDIARTTCKGYNGCIGNSDFDPVAEGMFDFSLSSYNSSPFFDAEQPCSYFNDSRYAGKKKRFLNASAFPSQSQNSASYQVYLQTGQCPLAFQLQYLLGKLAATTNLTNTIGADLTSFPEFTPDLYNVLSGNVASPFIPFYWQATSVAGDVLSVNIINSNNSSTACTLTLDKTGAGITNWSDIVDIKQLVYTSTSGGLYYFTATAVIANPGDPYNPYIHKTITGSSCINILDCKFKEECDANEFASQLSQLMTALAINNQLLSTTQVSLTTSTYQNFVTPVIKNTLGQPNGSMAWKYLGNGVFELYDATDLSRKLTIKFNSYDPSTFTALSLGLVKGFTGIKGEFQNFFSVNGLDANGAHIVTIHGEVKKDDHGVISGISMGDCELPTPIACSEQEHEVLEDLEALLDDVLTQKPLPDSINLFQSPVFTSLLQSYIDPALTSTTSDVTTYSEGSISYEEIAFDMGDCDLTIRHRADQIPPLTFADLISVTGLTATGNTDFAGNYHSFYAIGTYVVDSVQYTDTLWGTSCWPLKNCDPCTYEPEMGGMSSLMFASTGDGLMAGDALSGGISDEECMDLYNEYAAAYDNFVATYAKENCPDFETNSPFYTYEEFLEMNLCCSTVGVALVYDYIESLNNAPPCPGDLPRLEMCEMGCDELYNSYVDAYNDFVAEQRDSSTCERIPDLYSYEEVVANNLCCNDTGIQMFQDYIASLLNAPPCPGELPENKPCITPCEENYNQYMSLLTQYNSSAYATGHGHSLPTNTYPNYQSFVDAGLCECVSGYISYLTQYLSYTAGSTVTPPVPIHLYSGCQTPGTPPENECATAYDEYTAAVSAYNTYAQNNPGLGLPQITATYTSAQFTVTGFCYCVDEYVAYLNGIMNGTVTPSSSDSGYVVETIADRCVSSVPCSPSSPQDTMSLPPYTNYDNPCAEYIKAVAIANATNAYNEYIKEQITYISSLYTQHCMSAVETYTAQYTDKEYHFTLYYYDQAGNLIRTVPPEGVKLITANADLQQVNTDRTNNTRTIFTDHLMATTYEYNSLNQLVKQSMPDHDKMDIWELTLPNGLDSRLKVTATQFVSSTKGYLTGYITPASASIPVRGYLYTTNDGGATWTRMEDVVASDLEKVQMVSATEGFAVGNKGIILKTIDGGSNWDMLPLYNMNITSQFNDLYFTDALNGLVVGENGKVLKTTDGGTTFTALGTFSASDNIVSITKDGTDYYIVINNGTGKIYKSTDGGVTWTQSTSIRSADLTVIRYINSNDMYAVGVDGTLLKSVNGGTDWTAVATGTTGKFRDAYFKNVNEGVAIIENATGQGEIWKTFDGGATWTLMSAAGDYYNALHFYTTDKGVAVGNNGLVKRVVMTQQPFGLMNVTAPPSTSYNLNTVWATTFTANDLHILTGGDNGALYSANIDFSQQPPVTTWDTVVTSIMPSGQNTIKKISAEKVNALSNPSISAVIITNDGLLYGTYKSNTSNTYANAAAITTPAGAIFTDVTDDKGTYATKKIFAVNSPLSGSDQVYYLNLTQNAMPAAPVAYATTVAASIDLASIAFDGGKIALAGDNGDIFIAALDATAASITSVTDNSTKVQPLQLNDIQSTGIAGSVYAVGADGTILETVNGANWKMLPGGTTVDLNSIKFNTSSTGLIAGNDGTLYTHYAPINSITLTPVALSTTEHLYDIAIDANNRAYVAGAKGTMVHIPDMTATVLSAVVSTPQPGDRDFRGVVFKPGSNGVYAVGDRSSVYQYMMGSGGKVRMVHPPKLNDVHFTDVINGYAVGENYTVRYSNDGGATWQVVLPSAGFASGVPVPNAVWTKQAGSAVIAGNSYYIATLSGVTATHVTAMSMITANINDIAFSSTLNGYVVGASGTITKTTDGGTTWTSAGTVSGTPQLNAVHAFSNNHCMFVGANGTIGYYNGTSIGLVDYVPPTGYTTANFNDVFFHDDKNGYVAGDNGVLLKSDGTDFVSNGVNWLPKTMTDNYGVTNSSLINITTVAFASRYNGFFGGMFNDSRTNANYARLIRDESELFSTYFWYDRLGRMVVSQNTKQFNKTTKAYSYTLYDALGRIVEVGEKAENSGADPVFNSIFGTMVNNHYNPKTIDDTKLNTWISAGATTRTEVTKTYYDNQVTGLASVLPSGFTQEHLRKRVATVTYEDVDDGNVLTYEHATHYSYDIHGNVSTLLQDNKKLGDELIADAVPQADADAQRFKRVDYIYDLVLGKVNQVAYQAGQPDQFYHRYTYDADTRIAQVETSKNDVLWDTDAKYFYYEHGTLARTEVGDNQVQGIDHVYTLHGLIKGVNSNQLKETLDIGQDGYNNVSNPNKNFGKDAFGYTLGYYQGEYQPIDATKWSTVANRFEADLTGSDLLASRNNLFNGNISHMVTTITKPKQYSSAAFDDPEVMPQGTAYLYDQLNRLLEMKAWVNLETDPASAGFNTWLSGQPYDNLYHNTFTYDANGNILTQLRRDQNSNIIDQLIYNYHDVNGRRVQNRLYHVNDDPTNSGTYSDDIDDQGTFSGGSTVINTANNYSYDEIGNLKKDVQDEIASITWNVYGKIKEVIRNSGSVKKNLKFDYDASGNRVAKHVYTSANVWESSQYYLRDAQGNIMSIYKKENVSSALSFAQIERSVYGSSRIGLEAEQIEMLGATPVSMINTYTRTLGNKQYEGSNHLDNVLAVFTDKKIPRDDNADGTVDYYQPELIASNDYSSFGVLLSGRNFSSSVYRFGFNGKEKDDELKGTGNSYDFGARIQDPRLGGRFLSIDPLFKSKPWNSPYLFADNSPICKIDENGETGTIIVYMIENGKTTKYELVDPKAYIDVRVETAHANGQISWRMEKHDYVQFMVINMDKPEGSQIVHVSDPVDMGKPKPVEYKFWGNLDLDIGGIRIYGTASNSDESVASKTKREISGSFDFGAFSKMMGIIMTAYKTKKENALSKDGDIPNQKLPTFSFDKLAKWLDSANSTEGELNKEAEVEKRKKGTPMDSCTYCNETGPLGTLKERGHTEVVPTKGKGTNTKGADTNNK